MTFETSFKWDELTVVARFQMGDKKCDITVDDDNVVTIPHEITDVVGSFQMALRGESPEGRVLTSASVILTVVEETNV